MTMDEYVTANLATAPPLSQQQRDALFILLAPARAKRKARLSGNAKAPVRRVS